MTRMEDAMRLTSNCANIGKHALGRDWKRSMDHYLSMHCGSYQEHWYNVFTCLVTHLICNYSYAEHTEPHALFSESPAGPHTNSNVSRGRKHSIHAKQQYTENEGHPFISGTRT